MGISWRDGDAVGAWEMRLPGMEEFGEYPGMGKRGGGRKKSRKNRAAGRTHVQGVLRRLRLGAAVEADEAHGLRRKERGHHQSGWWGAKGGTPPLPPSFGGPAVPGEGGSMAWDARPVSSGSYLLGGEFDERPFVPLQEKNKKRGGVG